MNVNTDPLILELMSRLLILAEYAYHVGVGGGGKKYLETVAFLGEIARRYNLRYDLVSHKYIDSVVPI